MPIIRSRKSCNEKPGYYRLMLSVVITHLRLLIYILKYFISVLYILGHEKYFIEKKFITSVCQKRKPKIDGSLLNVLHI